MIEAWAGSVSGTGVIAFVNPAPRDGERIDVRRSGPNRADVREAVRARGCRS
jgi:hypothetical protein